MIVSFATDDDHYRPHAERLREQCDALGLEHDIRVIPPWSDDSQEHCCFKPAYILDRLRDHRRPMLWLDVDSVIHAPISVTGDFDIGFCDNPLRRTRRHIVNWVTGGAVAFRWTSGALDFLHRWVMSCRSRQPGEVADHRRMDVLRVEMRDQVVQADITDQLAGRVTFWGVRGTLAIPV